MIAHLDALDPLALDLLLACLVAALVDGDQSLLLDLEAMSWMGPMLRSMTRAVKASDPLFGLSRVQFAWIWRQVCASLNLDKPQVLQIYQLRHSGASRDRSTNQRSLMDIQKRGRWQSVASVKRYEKVRGS